MQGERKFAEKLTGKGTAARLRETVSEALRESTAPSKPKLIEPLDYETVIVKNKTLLTNDPHREMLLFPPDDVKDSTLPRRFRTVRCSVPPSAIKEATSLLVRECIKTYTSPWNVIHYKYSAFSGSYLQLPKVTKPDSLPAQVFEVDAEGDGKDDENNKRNLNITKQGWLYKGPESGMETSIISFTRSFKRRYFYLKQQADTTYVLEFHKDDRKLEAKGAIFLDSAKDIIRSSKRGKHAFEVQMQDKSFYVFAAESEGEMEGWVGTLKQVLSTPNSPLPGDRFSRESEPSPSKGESFRDSLEHSNNPELQKYARETDKVLAQQRKDGRQKLFGIYPDIQRSTASLEGEDEPEIEVYREQFGTRIIVRCEDLKMRLQANMAEDGHEENLSNPEPFFISLALFDAKEGKKISEDFHVDLNAANIRGMIPQELIHATDMLNSVDGTSSSQPELQGVDPRWIQYPRLAVFSVTKPGPDIYLVVRVEKVLQGSINQATEPYIRTPDIRVGTKIHKHMKTYCNRLGHYRMPFAWAARPVFKPYSMELDTYSDFVLYRQEGGKVSDDDLIKHLQDLKKPEKQGKWVTILGTLKINMYAFKSTLSNTLSSSLLPVKPFNDPPEQQVAKEVEEFVPEDGESSQPFVMYTNHLHVYPKYLKYDNQKSFAKSRNIACYAELRESDEDGTVPLKCIYGKPGSSIFTTTSTAAVLHHNTSPDFYEEIKMSLPAQLHDRHHLVFTFYHVSCELSKGSTSKASSKKAHNIESPIGYAWFPILVNGRVNVGEQNVRVSMGLPPGYLGHEQLGLGKGIVGPEIKWVDGGKQLFSFQLKLVSTTYTRDQHLHNFFAHCQKMDTGHTAALDYETSNRLKHVTPPGTPPGTPATSFDRELLKYVKSLHAVEKSTLINFLPTLFNQLFRLLTQTHSEDVAINAVRVLCHVVSEVHDVGKPEILHSYVKFVFVTEPVASLKQKSIHEELAMHLKKILQPTQADNLVIGKFMRHSWFFFEILIKSMAQHLLSTGRIKMARNERFPSSFQFHIQMLVQTLVQHIRQKHKEGTDGAVESRNSNISLAHFIKKCFTFMDRGFVFRLINHYIDNFLPSDTKVLYEYKFEFLRIVCNHEHYIQLNLPIMRKAIKNYKDLKHDYTLSDEFRRNHFLVGLLMHEVKMALSEVRDKRKQAIQTLRNLLAKHSFDERYASKAHQARIVTLYLPFLTVILENKGRLLGEDSLQSTPSLPNGDLPSQPDTPIKHAYPSTTSLSILENSLGSALTSPYATQRIHRDPTVFAMISGQAPAPSLQSLNPSTMDGKIHHGSNSSLASTTSSGQSQDKEKDSKDKDNKDRSVQSLPLAHHQRASSISGPPSGYMMRYEKLDQQEIKDLLICFLFIIKNLSEDVLLGWFNNSSDSDVIDFFTILEICMQNFKYLGRKRITSLCIISDTKRAHTLPNRITNPVKGYLRSSSAAYGDIPPDPGVHSAMLSLTLTRHEEEENIRRRKHALPSPSEADAMFRTMLEANLSSEVAMIVLDIVSLYTNHFKEQLQFKDGENVVMHKVFDLYLHFLQTSQSEAVQKHAFAALRAFINKFPKVLFQGEANMCGKLCYEILRCCNSRLNTTRSEACALMYILMRSNFEFSYRKSFTRVHLQVIISVSQLISELSGLRTSRFTDSLSIINSFANNDKAMSRTVFPVEVKDLTKRIRTVLMATSQMREHENDPEMLVDLQYSLAKSYASTPELRRTWLESMARIHIKHESFSEAAHCYIHIAALVAEYLRRRALNNLKPGQKTLGEFPQGCAAFKKISPNVDAEESGMRDDSGMQDVQYTEDHLVELLEECALYMEKAERYEILGEVYRLIIPIYEKRREFQRLASAYQVLYKAYTKVGEVQQSGRRLLGKYFRVAFFGQNFFEEEDGKEYIYKEPKITNLTEICDRLFKMYTEKFGNGTVKLIMDSSRVNQSDLDSKFAYVQVTYVTPHFEEKELEDRTTDFERNNNIRRFMYETPFTKNGKARGEIEDQYKKRNILTTSHSFPYVKKRIMVIYHKEMDLTPIEVAIDEMQKKVEELQEVISKDTPDLKKLQLRLAGSVSVQVNAGPLAYAEAFLEKDKVKKYKTEKVNLLKDTFREFVKVCDSGVNLNGRLVNMDQIEYQENLRQNLRDMVERLSEIFEEYLIDDDRRSTISGSQSHRGSLTVFNVISATGNTSNV